MGLQVIQKLDEKKHGYIGYRKFTNKSEVELKSVDDLHKEFSDSLADCFRNEYKRKRWLNAVNILRLSDGTFNEYIDSLDYSYEELQNKSEKDIKKVGIEIIRKMSAGHSVVLLAITKLVACVDEKTLVLIDEPETHLYPPLLSAFIRALNNLLDNRNGVAIIATHSPVILQEMPASCVWKLRRFGNDIDVRRPNIETFGENINTLTRDIFGLEVLKSGFNQLITEAVEKGDSYNEIIKNTITS